MTSRVTNPDLQLGVAPLTCKVLRYSKIKPLLPDAGLELWAAGNERVSHQLVITAGEEVLEDVSVRLTGDLQGSKGKTLDSGNVALLQVSYIPDPEGLGIADKTLQRRFPELTDPSIRAWPDPLPPLQESFTVPARFNQPVWIKVSIPEYCPSGLYQGTLLVSAQGIATHHIPLRIHVWPFNLPVTPHLRTAFGISYPEVLRAHESQGESHKALLQQRYYEILVDHRLSPYYTPTSVASAESIRYLRDPRVTSFQANRGDIDFLVAHGLLCKALFYPVDEPRKEEDYERLIEAGKQIHQKNPIARIVTPLRRRPSFEDPVELLAGTTWVWCPHISTYDSDRQLRKRFEERRDLGEEIWVYVSGPGGDYCNFFVHQKGILHRLLFWQLWRYHLDGLLYWDTTYWKKVSDPWKDMATWFDDRSFGNGSLLYPGKKVGLDEPVSSQRLECILAGMQDIEYFELLSQTVGEDMVQQIIAEMVTDFTDYSEDENKLEELRRQIGECLTIQTQ